MRSALPSGMATRILLIDDDVFVLSSLRRMLTRRGFEVIALACPRVAVAQMEALQPDVVLSDLWMPELTGDNVLAEAQRLVPRARRVLMSAVSDAPGARHFFIAKPWEELEMLAACTVPSAEDPGPAGPHVRPVC